MDTIHLSNLSIKNVIRMQCNASNRDKKQKLITEITESDINLLCWSVNEEIILNF